MHWEYVSAYLSVSAHACPSVHVCVSVGVHVSDFSALLKLYVERLWCPEQHAAAGRP